MLDRFKKGATSLDLDQVAFTSVDEAAFDVWDGEDEDNSILIGEHPVDPAKVKAHEAEEDV